MYFGRLSHDTEYAMVDRDDDLKIGIKPAITFGPLRRTSGDVELRPELRHHCVLRHTIAARLALLRWDRSRQLASRFITTS